MGGGEGSRGELLGESGILEAAAAMAKFLCVLDLLKRPTVCAGVAFALSARGLLWPS